MTRDKKSSVSLGLQQGDGFYEKLRKCMPNRLGHPFQMHQRFPAGKGWEK